MPKLRTAKVVKTGEKTIKFLWFKLWLPTCYELLREMNFSLTIVWTGTPFNLLSSQERMSRYIKDLLSLEFSCTGVRTDNKLENSDFNILGWSLNEFLKNVNISFSTLPRFCMLDMNLKTERIKLSRIASLPSS